MKNILLVTHAHILYGMPMSDVNSASAQPFKFGGKELEREGGMDFYDFEARRLDFALGRFTSPDPLCEQTPKVSPYAYCAADPVNFIDPTGEDVVVLLEEGFIGHLGMLIQNEKEKWQYYSINGDNVFVSNSSSSQSSFIGGRRYDDIGVGEWDTPQDFLDSSYNTDDDNNDSEKGNDATTNSYEYTVGYQIESSSEQDETMRNEFKRISDEEDYNLLNNNCASAVIKTLEAAGIEAHNKQKATLYKVPANPKLGESGFTVKTKGLKATRSILPKKAFQSIINNNSKGKLLWPKK